MKFTFFLAVILTFILAAAAVGQRRPEGPPPGDRDGRHGHDWTAGIDTNKNGMIEADEFQAAIDRTFAEIDRNGDGIIEKNEAPPPPPHDHMGPPPGEGGTRPGMPGGRPMPGMPPQKPGGISSSNSFASPRRRARNS